MYELLYTSFATHDYKKDEIEELLEQARTKNEKLGITGMLVYHQREIAQLLEGDESAVKNLYDTIRSDERHFRVKVFLEGEIEERAFTNWSMAYRRLDNEAHDFLNENRIETSSTDSTPMGLINESPNLGKKLFLQMKEALLNPLGEQVSA